jgi:hypothetical protein
MALLLLLLTTASGHVGFGEGMGQHWVRLLLGYLLRLKITIIILVK